MEIAFKKDSNKQNPFKEKVREYLSKLKGFKVSNTFYYFLILLAISIGFYLLMLVENNFSLAYGGDYSAQYIPMGYHIWDYYHEWIKTGHFTLFDSTLYLGANSFGSNAYYGLFSPFNIIICIFPRSLVPQSVAVCSMIKLSCAGLFFSFYMKSAFKVKENVSHICGIAYAFAGWGAFYLWYNNYQDILVFFPLVLWGIERTIKDLRPWLLCVGVFLLAICNYVLMVPYIICAFIYAMFRFFQQVRTNNFKDNMKILGFGVVGFAGGLLMAMFVVAPALMATLSSPKLDTNSYGGMLKDYLFNKDFNNFFKLLFSWSKAPDQHNRVYSTRVYYPIIEFFFPATTCRSLPTMELNKWDFDDMAVSLWCYVPFIMFLVPALIQSGKEKKWSHYIGFALLVLTLFTPFMYYLTMGFSNGYARWTLFVITSLIAYVGIYIDKIPNVARWHIHVGFAFAIIGIVAAWILTWKLNNPDDPKYGDLIHRFVEDDYDFTNLAFGAEIVYVFAVYLTLFFIYNKKAFHIVTTLFVAAEAIAMGNFVTLGHGYDTCYNNGYSENAHFKEVLERVQKNDKSYYRIYTTINDAYSVNNSFINNYNSVSFFHSLYNFEIDDFSLWTGIRNGTKSVSGNYRGKYQDLDNLLGIKYYFVGKEKSKYNDIEEANPNGFDANVPFDFTRNKDYEKDGEEYLVYENKNLSDFGYSYSSIYDGSLVKYGQAEEDIEFIENAINLSLVPKVNEDDAKEINEKYNNISIKSEYDPITTVNKRFNEYKNTNGIVVSISPNYTTKYYKINSYAPYYPLKDVPNIPTKFEASGYDGQDPSQWFVFCTSSEEGEPLFKAGTAIYSNAGFSPSIKYRFYFMDKNNKIFMCDSHDDDTTDNTLPMRGFYVNQDVYTLAVCGKYQYSYLYTNYYKMYYESKEDYVARKELISQNPIENVKYQADKFTFETHYSENRFVVSRVAFDQGWKIKAVNKDTGKKEAIKTYKGNGGFVSFVAPQGNYSYTMTYETPYLKLSYIVTTLSTMGFFVSLWGYHVYQESKRRRYLDQIYREN